MQRVVGIVFLVLALWIGLEVYNEGVDGAFGGLFASESDEPREVQRAPQRAADAVRRAYEKSSERIERQLDE